MGLGLMTTFEALHQLQHYLDDYKQLLSLMLSKQTAQSESLKLHASVAPKIYHTPAGPQLPKQPWHSSWSPKDFRGSLRQHLQQCVCQ